MHKCKVSLNESSAEF